MTAPRNFTRRGFLGLIGTTVLASHPATRSTTARANEATARAEDATVAQQLTDLGAQVTLTGDVVTKLSFRDCSTFGEAEYKLIGQVRTLKSLSLGSCKSLNDETLKLLAGLQELEEFVTNGVQITDAGLAGFAALGNLRSMAFFHPSLGMKGFDGSGFAAFKTLAKLERLTVAGTPFNDQGMAAIAQIKQLRDFRTWHTYQTQEGNKHLLELPALRSLWLGQRLRRYDGSSNAASVDDATLNVLAQLNTLELLHLDEARISLAALSRLEALKSLKKLELQRVDISAADVDQLKAKLPGVTVDFKPMTDEDRTKLDAFLKVKAQGEPRRIWAAERQATARAVGRDG